MNLLRAKLTPPRLRPSLIERVALIDRLNQGLSSDVTLITAPAGYGKTTLVAEWAAQATLPVAWLTVDAKDNDATTFVTYFIAAIRTLFPEACATSLGLAHDAQSLQGDLLPPILVNEIDDLPRRFALVIDDYYLISQPLIHPRPDGQHLAPPADAVAPDHPVAHGAAAGSRPPARRRHAQRTGH
jgi:LuxR family maltose regulon positive regulatory protein